MDRPFFKDLCTVKLSDVQCMKSPFKLLMLQAVIFQKAYDV
jgi:hypothetical protein